MIQRYDANGFPLPDVPTDGNFGVDFGREANYAKRGPVSAVADLAAIAAANNAAATSTDRTPASGKYIYDSKTGQYIWVPATAAAAPVGISASPAYINQERGGGGGRGDMGDQGGGFKSESPMAGPGPSTFGANLALGLDEYGNALGGILPGAFIAQGLSQAMLPSVTVAEAKANQERLAGLVAANPSYGGGNYGTPTSQGGYGVTSPTGAGIASGSMAPDPAQARGEGRVGISQAPAGFSTNADNAVATGSNVTDPSQRGAAIDTSKSVDVTGPTTTEANANAAAANAAEGGGGGGGGGSRVICTHFYRKGEMDRDMWRADLEFTAKHLSPTTVRGYQYWGIPYVKLMRKSKLAENVMRPIAIHRAKELAYQMGRSPKGSIFGKVVRLVCEPLCFAVGLFVGEQNWQALWTPVKD